LKEERLAARDAADEVNRLVARSAGYQIELLGWEETVSSLGRPQALINKELETCELFVGVMWKRWGTPPSKKGEYTSGFEEEYELSRKRFDKSGEPQMGMFFKNIDPELLADPGDDLKKVIEFQSRLIEEKAHLFQTFDNKEEFAQRVRQFLATHVHARTAQDARDEEERDSAPKELREHTPKEVSASATSSPRAAPEPEPDGAFLADLAFRLHQQDDDVSDVEIARLRLVAMSVKGAANDDVELGVHDANLLYRFRKSLEFSKTEINGLARTGLANIFAENVPFWTWYALRVTQSALFLPLASYLGTEDERVGALEAMRQLGTALRDDSDIGPHIRARWLEDQAPKRVKTAALRYLRDTGSLQDIPAIEAEIAKSSSDTLRPAIEAVAGIYLRNDPVMAATAVLNAALESIDPSLLVDILPAMESLSDGVLRSGLTHRNPQLRFHALEILGSRGRLDEATLRSVADDSDSDVRRRAIEFLDDLVGPIDFKEAAGLLRRPKQGSYFGLIKPVPEVDLAALAEFKRRRFLMIDAEALRRVVEGGTADRHLAMFCLAQRDFVRSKHELRALIDDRFQSYISQHWPDGVPGGIRNALLFGSTRPPEEEKRRELMRAALDVIEANPNTEDLNRVRKVIDDDDASVSVSDIKFLEKLGNASDLSRIAVAATRNSSLGLQIGGGPNLVKPAAKALLSMTAIPEDLLHAGLPPAILRTVLVLYPAKQFARLNDERLTGLLIDENDSVRKAAALKSLLALPKRRISTLLRDYIERERQFYNVIHWLDLGIAEGRSVTRKVARKALEELL
jgi:hypothetical protein